MFYTPPVEPESIRLDNLGTNRNGTPIRALAMDSQFLSSPDLETYNVKSHTHHAQKFSDVLYSDGHVASLSNRDRRFTLDLRNEGDLYDTFNRILKSLELADLEF